MWTCLPTIVQEKYWNKLADKVKSLPENERHDAIDYFFNLFIVDSPEEGRKIASKIKKYLY